MTPETARAVVAAYKRREDAAGGLANADILECVRLAAEECGVSYEDAKRALAFSPLAGGHGRFV
ncbi:MAG TPA: hypothetical protein PLR41_11175 [Alphaproteobacteria bacterium]|nr:hypothetical protein [Alphaproteobacteria bacterium]